MGAMQSIAAREHCSPATRFGKRTDEGSALRSFPDEARSEEAAAAVQGERNSIAPRRRYGNIYSCSSESADDPRRLRQCLNDLVGILALPALWSGCEPEDILTSSAESLMGMLDLDFCYARAAANPGAEPIEMRKIHPLHPVASGHDEIARVLDDWLQQDEKEWNTHTRHPFRHGEISIFGMRMGLNGELGVIVAGSQRAGFPEQTERLILSVAANQTAIGLQQARLLNEQKRIACELDQRVAERTRELAEANRELQLQVGLLQHLPVSAWTLKPDGTSDFVNEVWLEFSGQTLDFVRSHPEAWMTAVHPEDREMAARSFWEGVHSGRGFAFETRTRRARDGSYRWHLQQAVVLRDDEGRVIKFVGTTTDIDDQKRAEEALNKARSDLAHVSRVTALSTFTASIAHEINQPLSGIVTNASTCLRMLDADPPNVDGARETTRRALRDGNRVADVITRLRTLFTKKEVRTEPLDINEVAREMIALFLTELQRNQVTLRQELFEGLPRVMGDRVQLQQVILNLLRNATDAMSAVDDRPRELFVTTELAGEEVHFKVRDAGIGIDPAAAQRLFEPFYTTKENGMGIGLSLSRSIIEAHEGRLWTMANDGPGATFAFSLPGASLPQTAAGHQEEASAA